MIVDTKASSSVKSVIPIKSAVLSALGMAFAWGVIGGSVGLNALIKSNQQKGRLVKLVPPPTVVMINVNDIFRTGVVQTTVSALIAVLSFLFFINVFLTTSASRVAQALRIQAVLLAFCGVWLFATLVPFTYYFATRSAQVTASVGGVQLSNTLVNQVERSLGQTSVYRKIGYLRLVAIIPWITDLFTAVAAVVLFMASSRATATTTEENPVTPTDTEAIVEKENPDDKA